MMAPACLGDLAARYEAFLVDQYGVLLDGSAAYPFAPPALARLASTGKPVLLLSNSGRRAAPNENRLVRLGFSRDSFIGVLSSGEAARHVIADSGRRAVQVIPAGHADILDGLDVTPATGSDADLLLIAGRDPSVPVLDGYLPLLRPLAARGVPAICANPDLHSLAGEGAITFGPGRIAGLYATLGGIVTWVGKPHPPIYDRALAFLGHPDPARVLCIGDSPAHDIAGGRAAGCATALVRTGIHAAATEADLDAICVAEGAVPDHILTRFSFD
jgi:HAD superfamily hydrolase (TIGR01459 family)